MTQQSKPMDPNDPAVQAKVAQASKALAQALEDNAEIPVVPAPPADLVNLPIGLMRDKNLVRTAVVRELTGEHEEMLSRAVQTDNIFHFMDTLLTCGVQKIGDLDPSETKAALKDLFLGDRDELVLAIRRVTYGDELEVEGWTCPKCGGVKDITIPLADDEVLPRKTLDDYADCEFDVALSKGKTAHVRLDTGKDQEAQFRDASLTSVERNTILLQRCLLTVNEKNGMLHNIIAEPSYIRFMTIPDRHKVLKELVERRPGPRYTEIKFEHEECGMEVSLALGIRDLFRDLLLFL